MIKNSQKGQTLVEALVALGAAVVVIAAITIATISGLNNVQYGKNQNLATQYAQEGLEYVRHLSQANWSGFNSTYKNNKYWCYKLGSSGLTVDPDYTNSSNCLASGSIFSRQVRIDFSGVSPCIGTALIQSTVLWTDGKCNNSTTYCHTVTVKSCVTDLTTVPTP